MILLITTSVDLTANLLSDRLGGQLFRLDFDQLHNYALAMEPHRWSLSDPLGKVLDSKDVTAVFWWKAFNVELPYEDDSVVEEWKYVCRELYYGAVAQGLGRGNPPDFHDRNGKMAILGCAVQYFRIPSTLVTWRLKGLDLLRVRPLVAKSLSSRMTRNGGVLFTTEVEADILDPVYPWFLQERVDSPADQTVVVCGERLFGFERSRHAISALDWREDTQRFGAPLAWVPWTIPTPLCNAIQGFCERLGVDWGRLDLMAQPDGTSVFLEFNANGQWAFLDPDHQVGLFDAVVRYLNDPKIPVQNQ